MNLKYQNAKSSLRNVLEYYFRHDIPKWDNDNPGEIRAIIEYIEIMIEEIVKKEIGSAINQLASDHNLI